MSEWIIYVEFPIVKRRCGVVDCETHEQAVAVSVAYRDRVIAEEVIPSAIITVRRNTAEELGARVKSVQKAATTKPKS
jgi:hypothetical protein